MQRTLLFALPALFGVALLFGCAQAGFHVNTTQDLRDSDPGDGECEAVGNPSLCSLRAAIEEADAGSFSTNHHIYLPSGTYTLTSIAGVPVPSNGLSMDAATVTIHGAGASSTFIEPNFNARIFTVEGGALDVSGVTMRNGDPPGDANGGALWANHAIILLDSVVVENNASGFRGGGIFVDGNSPPGRLSISNSAIRNNTTAQGAQGGGGGIFSDVGTALIRTNVQGNSGGNGGGAWLVSSEQPSNITASSFISNTGHTGAGLNFQNDELSIQRSTFSSNIGCLRGGGIAGVNAEIDGMSVTVVRNELTIGTSTFCDSVPDDDGAGVLMFASATLTLTNSILAENHGFNESPNDCVGDVDSGGFNFVGTDVGCDYDEAASDEVGGVAPLDPELGNLSFAASQTGFHLPTSDSPVTDEGAACGSQDQRGRPRPADGDGSGGAQCDIGAIERQ